MQGSKMSDHKVKIKLADMSDEIQLEAIRIASEAIKECNAQEDIATYIKKKLEEKYNVPWHCVVGHMFGSYVTAKTQHFINFYLGNQDILLLFSSIKSGKQESKMSDHKAEIKFADMSDEMQQEAIHSATISSHNSCVALRSSDTQGSKTSEHKADTKFADMSDEMQQYAFRIASEAMKECYVPKDVAAYIKMKFDGKYKTPWNCVVGRSFSFCVTADMQHTIYFYLENQIIFLYTSPLVDNMTIH